MDKSTQHATVTAVAAVVVSFTWFAVCRSIKRRMQEISNGYRDDWVGADQVDDTEARVPARCNRNEITHFLSAVVAAAAVVAIELTSSSPVLGLTRMADSSIVVAIAAVTFTWIAVYTTLKHRIQQITDGYSDDFKNFEGYFEAVVPPLVPLKKVLCPISELEPAEAESQFNEILAKGENGCSLPPQSSLAEVTKDSSSTSVGGVWELQL